MNYKEFASKIKEKYPQYRDMDDEDLARRIIKKYPQYQDITFEDDHSFPSREIVSSAIPRVLTPQTMDPSRMGELLEAPVSSAKGIAQASGKVLEKPYQMAAETVSQRPELQPFEAGKPKMLSPNPLEAAAQTLVAPIRLGVTLQEPQMMAQGMTTDALLKRGVHPYIAHAAGMLAGVAADPINLMSALEIASAYGPELSSAIKGRMALKGRMASLDAEQAQRVSEFSKSVDAVVQAQALERQKQLEEILKLPGPSGGTVEPRTWKDVRLPMGETQPEKLSVPASYETGLKSAKELAMEKTPLDSEIVLSQRQKANLESSQWGSPETAHLPPNETQSYTSMPRKLGEWIVRSNKEMDDLRISQELVAPSGSLVKDLWGTLRRFAGHGSLSRFDGEQMMREMTQAVPDKERRMLLALYSDLGRAPTQEDFNAFLEATKDAKVKDIKKLSVSLEKLSKQNLNLSPHEQAALDLYNEYFKRSGQSAQRFKLAEEAPERSLIPRLRDKYGGPHLYVAKEEAEKGLFQRLITGKTPFSKRREFDNLVDSAKAGYIPKTLDAAELLGIYHQSIHRAAAQRYLMNSLEKLGLINYEGEGNQIKGFQPSIRLLEKGGETSQYAKIAYSPHPDVQRVMKGIAEDKWSLYDTRWYPFIERLSAFRKTFNLYLQTFHVKALGAEAFAKGFNPGKFKEGLALIDKNPELVRSFIRSGLEINDAKDIGQEMIRSLHQEYGIKDLGMVHKWGDIYTNWVFRRYQTGLKIWNASLMTDRLTRLGVVPERAIQLAVDDSNRVFGGLNYTQMARSEQFQRLMRTLVYAPDWTESRLLQMQQVYGGGLPTDYTLFEKQIMASQARNYWTRMLIDASVSWMANQVNPARRVLSIDLFQESGFKDVKKLAMALGGNPVYFTSKAGGPPRDFATLADPHWSYQERLKRILFSYLPIFAQEAMREEGGI
jgi:hypothetical protein